MKLGIVGLPNVGKSTLFNALTSLKAQSANYPFCTIDPNVGIVSVPDKRLDALANIYNPKKITPAVIEFVDIAGLVKGASSGEGLGNKFLSHIRQVDVIVHVVRCFEDGNIIHVDGSVNPRRDIETINLELILSDVEVLERRIDKAEKLAKGDKKYAHEASVLRELLAHLQDGLSARTFACDVEDRAVVQEIGLLSGKPVIYAANMDDASLTGDLSANPLYTAVCEVAAEEGSDVLPICAQMEAEICDMSREEKELFLSELGFTESGLDRLIRKSYERLGLISFLTAGEPEVRAWTITRGDRAPQAAGKIHTDFERGFIRAEVVAFDKLIECGSFASAKERGLVRSEGKEYVMQDGDVVLFRFNV
ncbi:MAG: redox-regulated ATPase YchF [Clostridium sp. SCN 57-10]|nr:MAG: redox-regulated ATPase YchF [Clostridium sp. SCN 57-10]